MEAPCFREIAIWTGVLFDKIKEKLSWMHGLSTFLQYNEAKPLNDSGNHEYFEQQGQLGGLGHPNYSNNLDLGFFHSLKARVNHMKIEDRSLQGLIDRVLMSYGKYDRATLGSIICCLQLYFTSKWWK